MTMKTTLNATGRKVVAVIGAHGTGLFFPALHGDRAVYINSDGRAHVTDDTWETVAADGVKGGNGRKAIYTDDSLTLEF